MAIDGHRPLNLPSRSPLISGKQPELIPMPSLQTDGVVLPAASRSSGQASTSIPPYMLDKELRPATFLERIFARGERPWLFDRIL